MKNRKINLILPLLLALFLVGGMLLGSRLTHLSDKRQFHLYPRTDKLSSIIRYIEQEYVDSVDKSNLVEKTIPEILKQLDPHSVYIPATELQRVNEPLEGNFSGIGVQFNMQQDSVAVINTIPNGPSELVGIMPGDRIVMVNDSVVAGVGMPSDDIVSMLKGQKGTKVTVHIYRRGAPDLIEFEITRDEIPLYSVDVSYMIDEDIGYMKISRFARTTHQEFQKGIQKLNDRGMSRLILDLRGNVGGYLNAAISVADEFLEAGELIVYTDGRSQPRQEYYADKTGMCQDKEVVVLIDEWSASASEIVAGALQDNDRGLIIGRRSFGKGLVQEQTTFRDGSALRLTIARYYTPTGRSIQKPYDNGNNQYYQELQDRLAHGEFVEADSIDFADSLSYTTPEGNQVYGGGGIMPDIFVPFDTVGMTDYLMNLRHRGLIYRYAFKYTDEHRSVLSEFEDVDALKAHLDGKDLIPDFIRFVEKNGVKTRWDELEISRGIIDTQIKAYIARNILDNEGFYPIIREVDKTVQKAVSVLRAS